jgi:hypothetical protein
VKYTSLRNPGGVVCFAGPSFDPKKRIPRLSPGYLLACVFLQPLLRDTGPAHEQQRLLNNEL